MARRHGDVRHADTLSILVDESIVLINDEWRDFYVCCFQKHLGIFLLPSGRKSFHPLENEPLQILLALDITECTASRSRLHTFKVKTSHGTWRMKAGSGEERDSWMDVINRMRAEQVEGNIATFAPIRDRTHFQTYIDGKDYFAAAANAIRSAKEEIFIAAWYLCPELFLERSLFPPLQETRLDNLLQTRAMEGVAIYIILYSEVQFTLNLRSNDVKRQLESLHPNIHVICHGPTMKSIQYCHHQKFLVVDRELAFLGGIDLAIGRYDDGTYEISDPDAHTFIGADYYNPAVRIPSASDSLFHDTIDRSRYPRMPWHDLQCSVDGESASDVALNFIQRWNHHIGGQPSDLMTLERKYPMLFPLLKEEKPGFDHMYAAPPSGVHISCKDTHCLRVHGNCRVIRSLGPWSGTPVMESSINDTMTNLILGSKYYVYIENQFFISSPAPDVQNSIGAAIIERISRAILNKEVFRVVIVTNVHGEGNPRTNKSLHAIMHHQFNTLCRGPRSILKILERKFPDACISDYFTVFTLRAFGKMPNGHTVTSPVYVHGKLMITDDLDVVISSANINDRSLVGDRDSEIGVHISDSDLTESVMNGERVQVGRTAHALRMRLWRTWLGLHEGDMVVKDAISNRVYHDLLVATATNNTNRLETCFNSLPSNGVRSFEDWEDLGADEEARLADDLQYVCGYIVLFPLDFLRNDHDTMTPSLGDAEFLANFDGKLFL